MADLHQILVGLGGNLPSKSGGPRDTIRVAVELLKETGIEIVKISSVYETAPIPVSNQPDFVNCALLAKTSLTADKLLALFQRIEKTLGREVGERWSARTIDVDLLAYDDSILPDRQTWNDIACNEDEAAFIAAPMVPHPRLQKRAFVLLPLHDIVPDWVHPCLQLNVREMLANGQVSAQQASVKKVSDIL